MLSRQLFKPLVDLATRKAVRLKLEQRLRRGKAPRSPSLYLAGLLYCDNCGSRMVAGPARKKTKRRGGRTDSRLEYMCGTYHRSVRARQRENCSYLRNGVFQDVVDTYVERYLDEAGRRLELLTDLPEGGLLTDRLEGQESAAGEGLQEGISRLTDYLAEYHPDEYHAILQEAEARREQEEASVRTGTRLKAGELGRRYGKQLDEAIEKAKGAPLRTYTMGAAERSFVDACLTCYRANFDASVIETELKSLREEHDRLVVKWGDLPTQRAKDTAAARFAAFDQRMKELENRREDAADLVDRHHREMLDLQRAIAEAKIATRAEAGERALRRRAEALRSVIHRVECTFTATGRSGGGPGKSNSRLTKVTIYPVCGEAASYGADDQNVIPTTSVVSR